MGIDTLALKYDPSKPLDAYPARLEDASGTTLAREVRAIRQSQELLYADGRQAVLFIFQGMDCAGKDSTIKHVLSGVNPQGVHVANFRAPSYDETAHSFLWRYWRQMPRRGRIGIFNRSYYEEVVILRVHPEMFERRRMPHPELNDRFWASRHQDIASLEDHLSRNGIHVVKFFLNLSKDEQKRRLLDRINKPKKHWKFDPADVAERKFWDEYRYVYGEAISATHTQTCPWYILPADHKPTLRTLVAGIMAEHLANLALDYPVSTPDQQDAISAARRELLKEG